ncbi:MAG: hypothetical protein QOF57_2429, partial [Frankiaceae bacterium]|nr:hypothetical protein [Frankiaceae bacterium]
MSFFRRSSPHPAPAEAVHEEVPVA